MTRFSPTSGTTSASVPMAAILTKAGQPLLLPVRGAERLHELQRDADAGEVLVGIRAVVPLRVDDGERRRQRRARLVVVGDDEVEPELARAQRRFHAADAAVDRDDQLRALGVQPIDRGGLQAVAVLQALGDEVADVAAQQLERRGAG